MLGKHEVPSPAPEGAGVGEVGAAIADAVGSISSEMLIVASNHITGAAEHVHLAAGSQISGALFDVRLNLEVARHSVNRAHNAAQQARSQFGLYLSAIGVEASPSGQGLLPEWDLLSGTDVASTPDAASDHIDVTAEAKRTACSINCLGYLYQGDDASYEVFVQSQPAEVRLTREEFDTLHTWIREVAGDDETFEVLQYIMLIHDIGKSGRVYEAMGLNPHDVDHDAALTLLLTSDRYSQARDRLLPTFEILTPAQQQLIKNVLGIRFNYPQFLQGEAPAAALEDFPADLDPQTRDIFILHAMLDIAGAVGHLRPNGSATLTSPTNRRMRNLNEALRSPTFTTPEERSNAFWDAEARYFAPDVQIATERDREQLRAQMRLAGHLRLETPTAFGQLRDDFLNQPEVVKRILAAELNRSGTNRATLPYYGPALLRVIADKIGGAGALTYYAHILQEAHIADGIARKAGQSGVITAAFGDLTKAIAQGRLDPRLAPIRFAQEGTMLVPYPIAPALTDLEGVPQFTQGEQLRGKRILMVGMGGGSDAIQAAMLGKVLEDKYGSASVAVVSVRNEGRVVAGAGQQIGAATKEITAGTKPVGDWRFLENIPLEGERPTPTFIMNASDPEVIARDLAALRNATGADMIIGVDTGGDSLYRSEHAGFSAHLPTDITPDHDYLTLQGLVAVARQHIDTPVFTAIVAPGVDCPPYAKEVLRETGAEQVPLTEADKTYVQRTYAEWRMDGSGSEEGRYGKTPLAWLQAIHGNTGLQVLDLPGENAVSVTNPWRTFTYITPAMAGVVLMDVNRHFQATERNNAD